MKNCFKDWSQSNEYDILKTDFVFKTDFILKTGLDLSARQFECTRNPVGIVTNLFLTLLSAVSSADNRCKRFAPRSGPTKRRARSGSKLSDTLMVFLKEFFEKVNFEKISRRQKSVQNYPACKELKEWQE